MMEYEIGPEEPVSQAVITSVSNFENTAPTDLPMLHESLDPEALDRLFAGNGCKRVSFAYSNSKITVSNGEYLTVEAT
jgi:hypothetical protein